MHQTDMYTIYSCMYIHYIIHTSDDVLSQTRAEHGMQCIRLCPAGGCRQGWSTSEESNANSLVHHRDQVPLHGWSSVSYTPVYIHMSTSSD